MSGELGPPHEKAEVGHHEAPWTPHLNGGWAYEQQVGAEGGAGGLAAWLAARYLHSTEEQWAERVRSGEISVDGQRWEDPARPLKRGAVVCWCRPPWWEPAAPRFFGEVLITSSILVVDKPSGLPTLPSGGYLENTLLSAVRERYPGATPAHRLGTGTSGLVLFARSAEARREFTARFRDAQIERGYLGVAAGQVPAVPFTMDLPIGPTDHPRLGSLFQARADGVPALTEVRGLAERDGCSLVELRLGTGRPHQIRIHLAGCGHPLVGDPLYGGGGVVEPAARPSEGGYRLHAHRLRWTDDTGLREVQRDPPWLAGSWWVPSSEAGQRAAPRATASEPTAACESEHRETRFPPISAFAMGAGAEQAPAPPGAPLPPDR